jgi:hypothetical protein
MMHRGTMRVRWAMGWIPAIILLAVALTSCGPNAVVREVHDLRVAGYLDSARTIALRGLDENANQMDLWLEFAYTDLDLARNLGDGRDSESRELILQAALTCGAMYQHEKREPPKVWRDAGRLISSEIGRQLTKTTAAISAQSQTADYIKQLSASQVPGAPSPEPVERGLKMLDKYRGEARRWINQGTILQRLMENLPEANPGITSLLTGQLESAQTEWQRSLDLDPAFMNAVREDARITVNKALGRANEDLEDVGYFLPKTIVENGVFQ